MRLNGRAAYALLPRESSEIEDCAGGLEGMPGEADS